LKRKWIIGGAIIVVAAIWLVSSFSESLTAYVSFDEAKQRDRRVQVIGSIIRNDVRYDTDSLQLVFDVKDDDGETMTVVYSGTMPGNFDQATKVVCKGKYTDGRFVADELLLKCPSKYQGES
jgi:cytochrome c-type biogenesis protein CcmE